MKNSSLLTLRAIGLIALLGCLSAVCAAPIYTPAANSFFLVRDTNANTFAIQIPNAAGLDVTVPAGSLAFFPQTDADTFSVSDLGVTEAVSIDISFATALDSPGVLNVLGLGSALTPLTNPLLTALGNPLNFTFDLIQFDPTQGSAIYALRNFEAIQGGGGDVPEPATVAMIGSGLGLLALLRRRR